MKPLPRAYLVGALVALALGAFVVAHQLIAPVPPVTTGCFEATFDTVRVAGVPVRRWISLEGCPHFDRTEISLRISMETDSLSQWSGAILAGSLPGGPREWPRHLRVRWHGPDTVVVEHDAGLRFLSRWDTAAGVRIVYRGLGDHPGR